MNTFTIGASLFAFIAFVVITEAAYEDLDYYVPAEDEDISTYKRYYLSPSCRRCMHSPSDYGACLNCYSRAGSPIPYYGMKKRSFEDLYAFAPEDDHGRQISKRSSFLYCKCCMSMGRSACCNRCGFRPGGFAKRGYETSFVAADSYGSCSCCEPAFYDYHCCKRCQRK